VGHELVLCIQQFSGKNLGASWLLSFQIWMPAQVF